MSDYNGKVRRTLGGDQLVCENGGEILVEAGGIVNVDGILDPPVVGDSAAGLLVTAGVQQVLRFDIPDAASADYDATVLYKARVTGVKVIKTGGAGAASNTITVKNGSTAITDAIDTNIADKVTKVEGTIDDLQWDIAAGGTLRVSSAKSGGNAACTVLVTLMRVA